MLLFFFYNRLTQILIQQTNPNRLLQISFFLRVFLFILNSFLCCMWRLRYEFAAMFVTFVCISYFASQIYVNLTRETFLVSREQNLTKFVYFPETMMYESSVFQINMMVCINLVVNSVLLRFRVMPGILR